MNNLIQKVGVKWGLIVGVASVAVAILQMEAIGISVKLNAASVLMGALGLLITVGGTVLTLRDYRTQNEGYMTLGQGFKTGMVMFAISSVISAIYNWVAFKFLHPNLSEEMVNATMAQLEATPGAQEEMLEMMEGL